MIEWAEKYRPKSLNDVVGNRESIQKIREWGEEWKSGKIPKKKALVFEGGPGVGKTSAALALAHDMGWGVIELNASDIRNEENIKNIALKGSLYETFDDQGNFLSSKEGKRKLIILDEADNLYEAKGEGGDRGGRKAIIETIEISMQPIVLIVNDPYELFKGELGLILRKYCDEVKFRALNYKQIASSILAKICSLEGIYVEKSVLERIAQRSGGDVRAAINDLQMLSMGKKTIRESDLEILGFRDVQENIYSATLRILLSISMKSSLDILSSLDEDPSLMLHWLDENLPDEYLDLDDLSRAMNYVSLSDLYLSRIKRRQYFGFLKYVSDFTAAVSIAKKTKYGIHEKLKSPEFLKALSQRKRALDYRNLISAKLSKILHQSSDSVNTEFFDFFREMFKTNEKFAVWYTAILNLNTPEIAFLLNKEKDDEVVMNIYKSAREIIKKIKV